MATKLSDLLGEPPAPVTPSSPALVLTSRSGPGDSSASCRPQAAQSRTLGSWAAGEDLPMSWPSSGQPVNLEPKSWTEEQRWWFASQSPASQMVVVILPESLKNGPPGEAWLAIAPTEYRGVPLLLTKLPMVMWTGEPINVGSCHPSLGS